MSAEKPNGHSRFVDTASVTQSSDDLPASASPLNPRLELELRKEKKVLEEESQYTYKPILNKPKKGQDKGKPDENRFDRLYSDALKRHLESKWKESAEDKDLTFTPKISAKGNNSRAASRERGSAVQHENIAIRLYNTPKVKQPVEAEEFSFKPSITKRAKSIDRSQLRETPDRLFLHSKVAKEKQEKLKQEFDQRTFEDCTFAPKTNSAQKTPQNKKALELTERMDKYEEFKNRRREEAQRIKREEELQGVTFKPQIKLTKRSSTPTKGSVYERLASGTPERDVSASFSEFDANMTFKPQLISKRSASPSPRAADYKDVHERLFKEGVQRKKDLELERQLMIEEHETQLTFTPVINPKSRDAPSVAKADEPVFDRLSTTEKRQHMQEALSKIKVDLEMRECTFKPKLLTESRVVSKDASTEPIHVRLVQEGERLKADQHRKHEERLADELKEATFSPQIPGRSTSIARRRSSVTTGADGSDDIYTRLNAMHTTSSTLDQHGAQSPPVTKQSNVVLPKQDLDKVFRRLSITTTESLGHAYNPATVSDEASTNDVSVATRRSSLALPEEEVNKVFTRLNLTRTASSERMVMGEDTSKSPVKVKIMAEGSLDQVFRRLSVSGSMNADAMAAAVAASKAETFSPFSSPVATGKTHDTNAGLARKDSSQQLTRKVSSNTMKRPVESTPPTSAAKATDSDASKPSSHPVVKSAAKNHTVNGETHKISSSNGHHHPQKNGVPEAPVPHHNTSVVPPRPPAATEAPAAAKKPTSTNKAPSAAAAGGDFFSKLEASLNFLETQMDTKNSFRVSPQTAPIPVPVAPPAVKKSIWESVDDAVVPQEIDDAAVESVAQAPKAQSSSISKIPASPKSANTSAKSGKSAGSSLPTRSPVKKPSSDSVDGGPRVLKGKKKSVDPPATAPSTAGASAIDDADAFLEAIPVVATEGSDSEQDN